MCTYIKLNVLLGPNNLGEGEAGAARGVSAAGRGDTATQSPGVYSAEKAFTLALLGFRFSGFPAVLAHSKVHYAL